MVVAWWKQTIQQECKNVIGHRGLITHNWHSSIKQVKATIPMLCVVLNFGEDETLNLRDLELNAEAWRDRVLGTLAGRTGHRVWTKTHPDTTSGVVSICFYNRSDSSLIQILARGSKLTSSSCPNQKIPRKTAVFAGSATDFPGLTAGPWSPHMVFIDCRVFFPKRAASYRGSYFSMVLALDRRAWVLRVLLLVLVDR